MSKQQLIEVQAKQNELSYKSLWQKAFDEIWNEISVFIVGKEGRGDLPPCKYSEVFMMGGRGSGKSYTVSEWIWLALTNDHKKNAVVLRKTQSSIRKSCFKQMVKALKKLRLSDFWTVNKTDLTITNKYTKQQVIFLGLDDEDKVRSVTTDVGYFSIIWFEEARQFASMEEIRQTMNSVLRGGADDEDEDDVDLDEDSDAEFMMFMTYNPPKSAHEWINKEAKKIVKGRLVHKSTYLTMPVRWLGRGFVGRAEALRESDPDAYRHEYLGEITGTGGQYFTKLKIREITDEEIAGFDYSNQGIDFGTKDPNVWLRSYYDDDKDTIYVFDEIYQEGENEGAKTNPNRYEDFAEEIVEHQDDECKDDEIFCDCQGKAEKEILEKDPYNLNVLLAPKHGANDRRHRYSWLRSKTIVVDPKRCPRTAEALQLFESKELPNGEGWSDDPGTTGDHIPDALGYSYTYEIQQEGAGIA